MPTPLIYVLLNKARKRRKRPRGPWVCLLGGLAPTRVVGRAQGSPRLDLVAAIPPDNTALLE